MFNNNSKRLFSANFEESISIVEKSKIDEIVETANIKSILKKLLGNVILIFLNMFGNFVVGPGIMHEQNIPQYIISIWNKVALCVISILIIVYIMQIFYALFPRKITYKFYIFSKFNILVSLIFFCLSIVPVMWAVVYRYSVILSIILIFVYLIFAIYTLIKEQNYYRKKMYNDVTKLNNFTQKFINWIMVLSKRYGGWLIGIAILLKSIFNNGNIGFLNSLEEGIYAIICIIFSFVVIKLTIGLSISEFLQMYYINKYTDEYCKLYNCPKEKWYVKNKK